MLCDTYSVTLSVLLLLLPPAQKRDRSPTERSLHAKDFFSGPIQVLFSRVWKHLKKEALWNQINPSG